MTCSLCGAVALYRSDGAGFCRNHYAEAETATKKRLDHMQSKSSVRAYLRRKGIGGPSGNLAVGGAARRIYKHHLAMGGKPFYAWSAQHPTNPNSPSS